IAAAACETTVPVVAQRLSTVAMADRIIVMDRGVARAVGRHRDLVMTDPLYAELAATQLLATCAGDAGSPHLAVDERAP
ncbi:MAG: ABC transporter ATP-binding protein, partial [Nocardioidaceae bacterium]|nr:ABC transporter ATP-binding protein [Nocardioidaceae bacterium]